MGFWQGLNIGVVKKYCCEEEGKVEENYLVNVIKKI